MSPVSSTKSPIVKKAFPGKRKNKKGPTSIITVRIEEELNINIDKLREKLGMSKADLIRNYLEISKYLIKQKSSLQSLNKRDMVIVKKSYLRKLIEKEEESHQINFGENLARFINDIATIKNKSDDLGYKLDLCDNLGFFPREVDEDNYILVLKKFGPKKFVEAFIWSLFKQKKFNPRFTENEIKGSKSLTQKYNREIHPVKRSSSHYSFEFARLNEK